VVQTGSQITLLNFFVSVMWKPNFYQTQVFEVIVLAHMHKFSWARAAERILEPLQASTGQEFWMEQANQQI
jgi:hypothetical protein